MAVAVALLAVVVVALAGVAAVQHRRAAHRATTAAAEIERLVGELATSVERADAAEHRAHQAESRAEAAETEAGASEAALTAAREATVSADKERAAVAESLWALELARSERTWRHSVSIAPGAPSPFADADDPLRLAVEIEAAALHEDVGATLAVEWHVSVESPSRRLLVLRTAQELLALAAREDAEITLRATGGTDDEVVFSLTPDDDAAPLDLARTPVAQQLVTSADGSGLRLTVR
ncbi:MAG: hypothetical protein ACXIVQ_13640 [Acidimicrobiales bacterium]